jgi:C-terminal processing protease CtpA/Prc
MTIWRRWTALASATALLAGCGGGGGSGGTAVTPPAPAPTPAPTPPPTTAACGLAARQAWVDGAIREWYLFPETLPATLNGASYATLQDYVDAMTATARAQNRDRFFTYVTSIAEENAYFSSGATAGFGIRLQYDTAARRVFVIEAFENAPALNAGIDRGDEITAIGTSASNLRSVADIMAAGGTDGVVDALGPSTAGVSRTVQVAGPSGTRTISIAKADYNLAAVSSRYGAKVIDDGGRKVGYINLRTFITSANQPLIDAFASFRTAGVTDLVIDFRYNGGGLVATAELMGDLLGRSRFTSDVFSQTTFRPEKASNNETRRFSPRGESVAPTRIAFITTGASASASELVVNAMLPYLGSNVALVGANSYGKPVGQIAVDRSACDDRLRVVAFSTRNAAGSADYYNGLASVVPKTCAAGDGFTRPLGDPNETSLRAALDFIAGKSCTPIATGQTGQSLRARGMLTPANPSAAQRETPGLF